MKIGVSCHDQIFGGAHHISRFNTRTPGPGCLKLGLDNPRLVWNLNSVMKAQPLAYQSQIHPATGSHFSTTRVYLFNTTWMTGLLVISYVWVRIYSSLVLSDLTRDIEDITWLRGNTNFICECWKYLLQVSKVNEWEILSAPDDKIRIPKRPCNVLFIL